MQFVYEHLKTVLTCITTMNTVLHFRTPQFIHHIDTVLTFPHGSINREWEKPGELLYLRSSEHADGGDSVEAVTAHQVGDVILDLHLLTREAGSLKQLSSGRVVVLERIEIYRKTASECVFLDMFTLCYYCLAIRYCRAKQQLSGDMLPYLNQHLTFHVHTKSSFELFLWSLRSSCNFALYFLPLN